MKYLTCISLLMLLVSPLASAQFLEEAQRDQLLALEQYFGQSTAEIELAFGLPDQRGTEAHVWSYLIRKPGQARADFVGYRQFFFHSDEVVGCRVRWFLSQEEAGDVYQSARGFMGEDNRTIAVVRQADASLFTDQLIQSLRGDAYWFADVQIGKEMSQATVITTAIKHRWGYREMSSEGRRLEEAFVIGLPWQSD